MDKQQGNDRAFALLTEASRVARNARMLPEDHRLKPNQRKDIAGRVLKFLEENGITQASVAREIGISTTTISEVLRRKYKGGTSDAQLIRVHNWLAGH